jgi:hypothetical protein
MPNKTRHIAFASVQKTPPNTAQECANARKCSAIACGLQHMGELRLRQTRGGGEIRGRGRSRGMVMWTQNDSAPLTIDTIQYFTRFVNRTAILSRGKRPVCPYVCPYVSPPHRPRLVTPRCKSMYRTEPAALRLQIAVHILDHDAAAGESLVRNRGTDGTFSFSNFTMSFDAPGEARQLG